MKEIKTKKNLCQVAGKKSNCMRLEKLDVPFHIALDQFDHCIDQISQVEGDLDVDHCRQKCALNKNDNSCMNSTSSKDQLKS